MSVAGLKPGFLVWETRILQQKQRQAAISLFWLTIFLVRRSVAPLPRWMGALFPPCGVVVGVWGLGLQVKSQKASRVDKSLGRVSGVGWLG